MRLDLVAHIKEQIASGRYVTEGKLKIVADRLFKDLSSFGPERPEC